MIHMPLAEIIAKIKENSGLSDESINSKIEQKLTQLSGLISKEGAAHIIANELGIKLIEQTSGRLQIKNIMSGMRNVEAVGKVQSVYEVREFVRQDGQSGKVGSFMIADETGSIRVVGWGIQADAVKKIKESDIIKIKSGFVKENNGRKEVHLNDRSEIMINPKGESVGETKVFEERPKAIRKTIKELSETDNNVEVLGTIVQVFEPKFFEVCPQCGKRARQRETSIVCDTHGEVTPEFSYVMNIFLDDGSDNIRVVCFRNQAQRLVGITNEQFLGFRQNTLSFDDVKNELLGNLVKFTGRVTMNPMFNRMEFIAQLVDAKPDAKEELSRLKGEELIKSR
jgi:replication factor A1